MENNALYQALDPLTAALQWHEAGHGVALATVIETWGSAPRRAGSMLCIRDDGLFAGSVSGGCVEGDVIAAADASIKDGQVQKLSYGVSNTMAWEVGLACGGKISILVEQANIALIQHMSALREAKTAFALLLTENEGCVSCLTQTDKPELEEAMAQAMSSDKLTPVDWEGGKAALLPFNPPLQLIIIGAVHIAQALIPLATQMGYAITVIDPRQGFAQAERFQSISIVDDWPDDAMAHLDINNRTAIVTLTHDPKLDDPALQEALKSNCFYIGSLGSKKTHAARLERLKKSGCTEAELARIHGPVGLDIGATNPDEIALSIMAQITAELRAG